MRILEQWVDTFSASALGAVAYGARKAFVGNHPECRIPNYILLDVSWAGVTGGDGTSDITIRCRHDAIDSTAAGNDLFIKAVGNNSPSTSWDAVTNTGAPADGRIQLLAMQPPANVAAMPFSGPIWGYVFCRASNGGTAYTTGTVTVKLSAVEQ